MFNNQTPQQESQQKATQTATNKSTEHHKITCCRVCLFSDVVCLCMSLGGVVMFFCVCIYKLGCCYVFVLFVCCFVLCLFVLFWEEFPSLLVVVLCLSCCCFFSFSFLFFVFSPRRGATGPFPNTISKDK